MNFLGHLYFSNNDLELMIANLFGDFCKGNSFVNYSETIKKGVLLHRKIDHYIDNHSAVRKARSKLYTSLPKVSGIAIDLYFDHLLAIQWEHYHKKPYQTYLDEFYNYQSNYIVNYPKDFQLFLKQIIEYKWLNYYPTEYGLLKACQGVSKRISFPNELENAPDHLKNHEEELKIAFNIYMVDAIAYFEIDNTPTNNLNYSTSIF